MIGHLEMRHERPIQLVMPEAPEQEARNGRLVAELLEQGTKMNPLTYHLHEIDWAVFATLTWHNDAISSFYYSDSEQLRRKDFYWLIKLTCTKLNLRMRNIAYYYKTEWGDNLRGHANVLIAKNGLKDIAPADVASLMQELWTSGRYPKGLAKIEAFKPNLHLNGIAYQAKNEFDSKGIPLPFFEEMSGPLKRELYTKSLILRN